MMLKLGLLAGFLCLCIFAVAIYDSTRFVKVSYKIANAEVKKRVKFVLLADLHNRRYGPHNEKLFAAIEAEKPDFILSAGDLITSVPKLSMEPAEELVRNLAERYPFYYANGNHEYRIYHDPEKFGGMGAEYRSVLEKSGVCLLENQSVVMADEGIRIYGLDLPPRFYRKFRKTPPGKEELDRILGTASRGEYRILLAHNPAYFEAYASWGADLTLSGHVHGGIMRLPWLGGAAGKQRDVLQRKGFARIGPGLHRRAIRQRGGLQAAGQAGGVKFGVGEQSGGFLGRALLDVQVPGAGLGFGRAVERPHDRMAADEHGGEQRGREQHPEHRDEEPRPAAADLAQRELPQQGHGRITSSFAILPSSIESTRSACRARPRSWVMSSIVWL